MLDCSLAAAKGYHYGRCNLCIFRTISRCSIIRLSIQIIIEILVYLSLTNVLLWPIQQKIVRSMYRNVNEILSMICRHGSYISIKRKYKRKIRRVYNDALVIYYHEHMNDLSSFEGVKYRMDIDKHIFQMT